MEICRLKVTVNVYRPMPYHILQSAIYQIVGRGDPAYGKFLHNEGYSHIRDKRRYKLFTFTPLRQGRFYVSSLDPHFLNAFEDGARRMDTVGSFRIENVDVETLALEGPVTIVSTLSPLVLTRPMPDGSSAEFLHPGMPGYAELLRQNLANKLSAWTKEDASDRPFTAAIYMPKIRSVTVSFKRTLIKGHVGIVALSGDPEMLRTAFLCGLGEKNSMGFGAIWPQ